MDKIPASEAYGGTATECVIMGCMSTVGCVVYNALSLCHLFCVAVGTFFPIVTGERYLTVSVRPW